MNRRSRRADGARGTRGWMAGGVVVLVVVAGAAEGVRAGGLVCDGAGAGATCSLEVGGGMAFEVAAGGAATMDDGVSVQMVGDVTLRTPGRDFVLVDAALIFAPTADGETLPYELYGIARAPLGDMGLTDDMLTVSPMAAVGLVSRATLKGILETEDNKLPLAENEDTVEPVYLFFHFATGVELDLKLAERMGLEGDDGSDPFQYGFPGDVSLTLIFDPTDPYVYISTDARKVLFGDDDPSDGDAKDEEEETGPEETNEESNVTDTDQTDDNGTGDSGETDKSDGDGKKKKKKDDAEGEGGGVDIGAFALSGHGGIPFSPQTTWGLPDSVPTFKGQVYVETTVPLIYGISVSGPVVTYAGADGFEQGANGDVAVGFDIFGDVLGMSFSLGQASAGFGVQAERGYAYFSGMLAPDDSFLPDWVPIVPTVEANVAAYIDSAQIEETRLVARGQFGMDAGNLSRMSGIDLNELFVREGELAIDRHGVWLRGRSASNIHPDLVFGSEVVVEAFFSAEDFGESYILLRGEMSIGGTLLGTDAEARITPRGVFIEGSFSTPVSRIALAGEITANGPKLTGSAGVDFDLDGMRQAQQDTQQAIRDARDDVERLSHEINAMREKVARERQRDAGNVREARQTVADQQAEVDKLQVQIDRNKSSIASHNSEIRRWRRWYNRQPWYKKTWAWAKYLAKTAPHYAKIAELGIAIGGLESAKAVATGSLQAAQAVLHELEKTIDSFPIDADPRVAGLIAARETAQGVLDAALATVSVVEIPPGRLVGEISLTLSVAGLRGDVSAEYNGRELLDGHVNLDDDPEACVSVPAFEEVCAAF